MAFAGFPQRGLDFLDELMRENTKTNFERHRSDYEEGLLEPGKAFVDDMGVKLHDQLNPEIHADPRINKSLHRMNRDIRFSKDKTPYKTHFDIIFWQGDGRSRECPGYFFRMTPDTLLLGAGQHGFEKAILKKYREDVVDEKRGAALAAAVKKVEKAGYEVGGKTYKRIPKGFDAPEAREDLLLYSAVYAGIEMPLPDEVHSKKLIALCMRHFKKTAPLVEWIAPLYR